MKKIPLFIGLFLHTVYYVFSILSLGNYDYIGYGVGTAFAFWIYAMVISLPTIVFYGVDAIISLINSRRAFNVLKLIVVIGLLPLCVCVGASVGLVNSVIWNTYFLVVFVLEIISLFLKQR